MLLIMEPRITSITVTFSWLEQQFRKPERPVVHGRIRLIPSVFGVREDWIREWIEACGESWEGYESVLSRYSVIWLEKKIF